jgi:membrane-bound serine protease (ClpP class)
VIRRLAVLFLVLLGACCLVSQAFAQTRTIEVIEVQGAIDGSIERSVLAGIEEAEEHDAVLVVLQIDSKGVIGSDRTERIVEAISSAKVPVATWVGPPGALAANGAALMVEASQIPTMAPGSRIGPVETTDLRDPSAEPRRASVFEHGLDSDQAQDEDAVEIVELGLEQVIEKVPDAGGPDVDVDDVQIRFHKLDIFGRVLHAAAQPAIAYLFLLAGLFGVVFELFHPSTGPAGVSGLIALAFSGFGMVTLGASWIGVALIVLAVVALSIDLRFESLGPFTFGGIAALIAGSLLLFPSRLLRPSPWVLAFGIIGMSVFMVSVMTRVLRDLRMVASGELEVRDAHAHLEPDSEDTDDA